jgi:hypothetical protein
VEVIERLFSTLRMWTNVAVMWIEAVINVAVEVVGAVEPGAGSDEHTAVEPLGSVVPIGGAVVRGDVVEAIRASRLCSDIDRDLGRRRAWDAQQCGHHGRKGKDFQIAHKILLSLEKCNPDAKSYKDWKRLKFKEEFDKNSSSPKLDPVCKVTTG